MTTRTRTRTRLSSIKENSGEKNAFKSKYIIKTSITNPNELLKKNINVLLTSSSYDRRTKRAPTIDGHGKKTKLPLGRKSRKKKKYKKRKSRKKKKKTRKKKNRNVFGRGNLAISPNETESWDDLVYAIENIRTEYITRLWIDLADPTRAYRKHGCESYYDQNRVYQVEISRPSESPDDLRFKFIKNFIAPDIANTCKLSEDQILTQDKYEYATKTGRYRDFSYNQRMKIKKGIGYDMYMSEH